mgnify:CR=1 FL=1
MAMSEQDWNDVISTNLSSAFYWTKGLVRPMTKKRWGHHQHLVRHGRAG